MSWLSTTDDMAVFSPFRDYLGLLNLVSSASPPSKNGSSIGQVEDVNDFESNGVDCGLLPFMVPPVEETSPWPCETSGLPWATSRARSHHHRRLVTWCVFCRNNGESESVYASHLLKDGQGKTTCPILRAYACPICGASGDKAHTIKYCPARGEEVAPAPLKTARTSTGIRKTYAATTSARVQTLGAVGERSARHI